MNRQKTGVMLLWGGALAIVLGSLALVVGFVTSQLLPIYLSIFFSALTLPAVIGGLLLVLGARTR